MQVHTLVLWGERDLLVDGAGAELLAELTGGRAQMVADVGHTIPIEAPEAFRSAVVEFLGLGR